MADSPIVPLKEPREIMADMYAAQAQWHKLANRFNVVIIILGVLSIGSSLLVSTYSGTKVFSDITDLKIFAFISSLTTSIILAFSIVNRSNNYRTAWRMMAVGFFRYDAGNITLAKLIDIYEDAEKIVGPMMFNGISSK